MCVSERHVSTHTKTIFKLIQFQKPTLIKITLIYKISLFATSKNEMCQFVCKLSAEHENHNKNSSLATVFKLSSLNCTIS